MGAALGKPEDPRPTEETVANDNDPTMANVADSTPLSSSNGSAAPPPPPQAAEAYAPSDHLTRFRHAPLTDQNGVCYNIPTTHQAEACARVTHGSNSLQYQALTILHSKTVQITMACLLMLDVMILLTELALLSFFPMCHIIRRDGISCCPEAATLLGEEHLVRFLAGGGGEDHHAEEICEHGGVPTDRYEAGCDHHKWETVHKAEEVLFGLTIAILSLFMLELLVTLWALGARVFWRQLFYALDLFIVTTSLALELTFHVIGDDDLAALVGLVIIGRVWRFVRIGHGIVEVVNDIAREKYDELFHYTELLERELHQNRLPIPKGNPGHYHLVGADKQPSLVVVMEEEGDEGQDLRGIPQVVET
mmetsp:Transcript_18656/g.40195  ORF Transcript_18656/g.40195 Transcript_18656/m.40195 type:complete len:364 (+) Transcript_18656:237-1328(+)|eukprot:CAMPEP_0168746208 /NCGR_PEP_ID=MMETSP0724-20121128/15025_1 /TAXON_ID=265536 /ORGANISM="Amphiprora sp., Strain CCMP467" /LENGTH=363 /DNA_ID=CAMNT_0008793965 /DNA_START=1569 /DNA_END=2660 /DNA_ORIENTATION=-